MRQSEMEVSVIIVTRNEEKYIEICLHSILNQELKGISFEIIVVDGLSSDGTLERAARILESASVPYQIYLNPKRTLATGWNIGIQNALGKYVVRPDAHATLLPNYIAIALDSLKNLPDSTGVVGGRLNTCSTSWFGEIVSVALSTKVGVGNSSFRTSDSATFSDTAVYGIYKKSVFETVGFFNETLVRHQDTAFHFTLLKHGIKLYFNPKMKAIYFCRESLLAIAKQMFHNGYYLSDLIRIGILNAIQLRHMTPFIFFAFLLVLAGMGVFTMNYFIASIGIAIFIGYLIVLLSISIQKSIKLKSVKYILLLPVIFVMHLSYALGSFLGLIKSILK